MSAGAARAVASALFSVATACDEVDVAAMFIVTANPPTGSVEIGRVGGPGKRATLVAMLALPPLPLPLLPLMLLLSEAASAAALAAPPAAGRAPLELVKDKEPIFQWRSLDLPPLPLPLPRLPPSSAREEEAAEGRRLPRSASVFPSVFTSSLSENMVSVAPAPPLPLPCVNTLAMNTNSGLTPKRLA